jgi:pSer/pThr/pTyr-binding forkhead associated (FHA) protein
LVDAGTPMGTTVNGMRVARHILRQGDSIAVGNSVLMFNVR